MEIGVDRGVTLIPLVAFLARTRREFGVAGIDIKVQEQIRIMIANLDLQDGQYVALIEDNSLNVLPEMIKQNAKCDVVLLDGDHNYYTVSRELEMITSISYDHTIVVVDDVSGRWENKDLWYADRPGYENNRTATLQVETEKHGVKAAVDDFLFKHLDWNIVKPIQGEPAVLTRMKFAL